MGSNSFKIKDISLIMIKKNRKRDYNNKILDTGNGKISGYRLSIPETKIEPGLGDRVWLRDGLPYENQRSEDLGKYI